MSNYKSVPIICPRCKKQSSFTYWTSFNVDLNEAQFSNFCSGKLFFFTCPECGYSQEIDYPTIYHDMTNKVLIVYPANEGDEYIHKALDAMLLFKSQDYSLRIVRQRYEMFEKAKIFRAGFDDRTVEICKCINIDNFLNNYPDETLDLCIFTIEDNSKCSFAFLGNQTYFAPIEKDEIERVHKDSRAYYDDSILSSYEINQEWAINFLNKYHQ